MRICVFGAGAIGGYLAAKLAIAGSVELSIVARGAHLEAIKADGLRLIEDGRESIAPVRAAARAEDLGEQDYVVLALKAHSLALKPSRSTTAAATSSPSLSCGMAKVTTCATAG
jgi:2-dehydropantoate 2-reductase